MVKIRYSELAAGLHVVAEHEGRDTVIYLLPGLTPAQRQAALARVRSSGRIGHGPSIPARDLALAIAADKLRTTARNGAVAMRGHPMLLLPPMIVLVSAAIVFLLMSFVTVTIRPPSSSTGIIPAVGVTAPPSADPPGPSLPPSAGHDAPTPGTPAGRISFHHAGSSSPAPPGKVITRPVPDPSGTAPILTPGPSPTGSAPAASPSPSPSPSPTPSTSASGNCLKLGPLGLCVTL